MKKIFAISMLAIFAVGTARAEWNPVYDYYDGSNYNIATVDYVNDHVDDLTVESDTVVTASYKMGGYARAVQSGAETVEYNPHADARIPSVNAVAANFVPSVPSEWVNTWGDEFSETGTGKPARGSYVLTADVDDNGNVTYRWVGYGHTID